MISVIVPVYPIDETVKGYFLECVDRIRDYSKCQLIVVQNGGERIRAGADVSIYKPNPIGFARALNIGMALADGDFIAQVAADVFVEPGWADALAQDLVEHGDGIACPFHYTYQGPIVDDRIWCAAFMITRKAFTGVGYHDERLNHRFSDQDWCLRCKMLGFKVFSTGSTIVRHVEEGSTVNKMPEVAVWPEEEALMRKMYGAATYAEWMGRYGV